MKKSTTNSVSALPVFAGIDYHKAFSVVSLGDENGTLIEQEKLPNKEEVVRNFFQSHAPLKCVIENCRGNEWFTEVVKEAGCSIVVSNTYAVRLIADSKRKNDKIDSRILMELLAKDYLPTCYQPSSSETALRELVRWRYKLVCTRTKFTNCAHALLDRRNRGRKLSSNSSRAKLIAELEDARILTAPRRAQLDTIFETITYFDNLIDELDKRIDSIASADANAQRLTTIPGIGNLTAVLLIAQLGDVSRFKRAAQVSNYLGLVPAVYSSADKTRRGRITKTGSSLTRTTLVQAAWTAVRTSPEFRARYNRIAKRKAKNVAIIAVARTIAEVAYRVLRDQTTYDPKRLTLG